MKWFILPSLIISTTNNLLQSSHCSIAVDIFLDYAMDTTSANALQCCLVASCEGSLDTRSGARTSWISLAPASCCQYTRHTQAHTDNDQSDPWQWLSLKLRWGVGELLSSLSLAMFSYSPLISRLDPDCNCPALWGWSEWGPTPGTSSACSHPSDTKSLPTNQSCSDPTHLQPGQNCPDWTQGQTGLLLSLQTLRQISQ